MNSLLFSIILSIHLCIENKVLCVVNEHIHRNDLIICLPSSKELNNLTFITIEKYVKIDDYKYKLHRINYYSMQECPIAEG